MSKTCFIFFYEGYVAVAPTVINLALFLEKQGYETTIYAQENVANNPPALGKNTRVIYFSSISDFRLYSIVTKILYKLRLQSALPVLEWLFFTFQVCGQWLRDRPKITSESLSVGIDTFGSILAFLQSWLFQNKLIYLSLELNDPNRYEKISQILNNLERLAFKFSKCVIVQDADRFKTLCEFNHYEHPYVFYLPNSPIFFNLVVTEADNYWRNSFKISEQSFPYIVLQAGMIDELVLSKSLAISFASIPEYALVFHERVKRSKDDAYIKLLGEINSRNLFLSLEPMPYEDLDKIYASATIGLAFYKDIDNNFSQISMASGKLGYYLKHGKPVLVNNLESLSKLVETYQIGVVIKDPENSLEIEAGLQKILSNYDVYSQNAKRCFQEEFDFHKKVQPIFSWISETK